MISKVEMGSKVKVGEGVKVGSDVEGEAVEHKASKIGLRGVTSLSSSSSSYVMRGDAPPRGGLHSTTGGLPQLLTLKSGYATPPQHTRV